MPQKSSLGGEDLKKREKLTKETTETQKGFLGEENQRNVFWDGKVQEKTSMREDRRKL